MSQPIKVFIAHDNPLFRRGLRHLFRAESEFTVIGESASAVETLQMIRKIEVDVLTVDLSMPGNNGVEIVKQIKRIAPALPVLVLSMHCDCLIARRAIMAGAEGYLTKDADAELLIDAVKRLAKGGRFVDPSLIDSLIFQAQDYDEQPPHTRLSDRELEIYKMIVAGDSLNSIGLQLHISAKTVSTHKSRLMQKLSADSVADLVRYALNHKLSG